MWSRERNLHNNPLSLSIWFLTPCWSALDFWKKIAGYTGSKNQVKIDQKSSLSNFIFQTWFFNFLFHLLNQNTTSATSKWAQEIFSKIKFLKSVHSKEKMRHVLTLLSKFSLNLSTEEVWHEVCCLAAQYRSVDCWLGDL